MRATLALLLLLLAGCRASTPVGACDAGQSFFGDGGWPADYWLWHVGESISIELAVSTPCSEEPRAGAVHTAVLGPDSEPVEHTNNGAMQWSSGLATAVTFPPAVPGPYHLAARFEPNFGLAQQDLLAGVNRAGRAPVPGLSLPASEARGCTDFALTAHDAVLCQLPRDEVRVYRGGVLQQQLPAGPLAVVGNTVWLAHDGGLHSYVDTGTGSLLPGPEAKVSPTVLSLTGTADEVTVVGRSEAQRFAIENGTLVPRETWPFSLTVTFSEGLIMAASSGGRFTVVGEHGVCATADGGVPLRCEPLERNPTLAFDADGVWRRAEDGQIARFAPGETTPIRVKLVSGDSSSARLPQYFANRPRPSSGGPAHHYAVSSDPRPHLVDWSPLPGFKLVDVHSDWAAMQSDAGDVYFVR